jgi:hypothetical protein
LLLQYVQAEASTSGERTAPVDHPAAQAATDRIVSAYGLSEPADPADVQRIIEAVTPFTSLSTSALPAEHQAVYKELMKEYWANSPGRQVKNCAKWGAEQVIAWLPEVATLMKLLNLYRGLMKLPALDSSVSWDPKLDSWRNDWQVTQAHAP